MKLATTVLIGCVGALLALGMVMLYSSKMGPDGEQILITQLTWCGIGLAAGVTAATIDYSRFKRGSWVWLGFSVVLLIIVLIPIKGYTFSVNGASRWMGVGIGKMRFQPSEFAKIALIVALAYYCERNYRQMPRFFRGVAIPGLIIGPVLVLIFLEPDWGATLLLAMVSLAMLLMAGVRWSHFVPFVLAGLAGLVFLLIHNPVRLTRVLAWLDPEAYKEGAGFQTYQALVALGSGGWFGLGLGNGRQKWGFVPYHHSDFILSVIGEELGLVASLGVLLVFLLLILSGLYIAWHAREPFGFFLGFGLTLLIGLQAFINFGVVTGVLPNKGLPLPFISCGGSNLLAMLTSVGLLVSIARRASEPAPIERALLLEPSVATIPC